MPEEGAYAREAVSNMAFEAGCGAAIRHLTDAGLTAVQIKDKLSYPAPFEKIRETMYTQLLANGTVRTDEPDTTAPPPVEYVQERDAFGKISYRKKPLPAAADMQGADLPYRESDLRTASIEKKLTLYQAKKAANGEAPAYLSCRFGHPNQKMRPNLSCLTAEEREYIEGIPWPITTVCHRLDERMERIFMKLLENGEYTGCLYFTGLHEKIIL